jgi:hypothetical protein
MSSYLKSRLLRLERAEVKAAVGNPVFEAVSGPLKRLPRDYTGERHIEIMNRRPGRSPNGDCCEFVERPGPEPPEPRETGSPIVTFCFIELGEGR